MMKKLPSRGFLALSMTLLFACSLSVPATVTQREPIPLERGAGIHVITKRHRGDVLASLEKAGLNIAADYHDIGYSLEVKIGANRADRGCRSSHNVSYTLWGYGQRLLVMKGRGPIGACEESVLEEMSQELSVNMN